MAEILATNAASVEATLGAEIPWQQAMKGAIRSGRQLCHELQIDADEVSLTAERDFSVFVPWEYANRMRVGEPADPLLRQVLARVAETQPDPLGKTDPVGDLAAQTSPGLLQKYNGRALLIATGACAVHCRYCFRRHYPYSTAPKGFEGWQRALDAIAADDTLSEVILSGGDPLTLTNSSLGGLLEGINGIAHVRRLRIHTRLPVVIPQRVDQGLLECLRSARPAVYFVLHFNHAQELDEATCRALRRLRSVGTTLLNQAVLLRGVNDSFQALSDLCLQLSDQHVLPYYLHQLDPVLGARHFEVSDGEARELICRLREHLPGYAVPRLVREVAGNSSKTVLA